MEVPAPNMAAPFSVQREMAAAIFAVRDVIKKRRATMLEALGGGGLVLIRDNAQVEGRSLLRALVSEAVARAEQVLVLLLEVPKEQFLEGLSPDVAERLEFRDVFGDPLGWLGRDPPGPGGLLGGLPRPSPTLVLDSLSWALHREPLPHLGHALRGLMGEGTDPPPRILALLHQDLHPPALLGALGGLARAQLVLEGPPETPGDPPRLRLLRDPRNGGRPLQETLTLLPDGSWGAPPQPLPPQDLGDPKKPQNFPNLGLPPVTFRLGLSGPERGARAALDLPYLPRAVPDSPPEDFEDPDEDLDL